MLKTSVLALLSTFALAANEEAFNRTQYNANIANLNAKLDHVQNQLSDPTKSVIHDQRWNVPSVGGSFIGHVVPGAAFLLVGLRFWGRFIYEQIMLRDQPYNPRVMYSAKEAGLVAVLCFFGALGEFDNGNFIAQHRNSPSGHLLYAEVFVGFEAGDGLLHYNFNNLQHIQFYMAFCMPAIACMLEFWFPQRTPKHIAMWMAVLAFFLDSFQWYIHSIAKAEVHCMQHLLFSALSAACGITGVLEIILLERKLLLLRSFLTTMTGCWSLTMAILMKTGWPVDLVANTCRDDHPKVWPNCDDYHVTWETDVTKLPPGSMMMLNAALFSQIAMTLVILGSLCFACILKMVAKQDQFSDSNPQGSTKYQVVSAASDLVSPVGV